MLTREDGVAYDDYLERISRNSLATKVKIADLRDNMDLGRLPQLTEKDLDRVRKYHAALIRLQ